MISLNELLRRGKMSKYNTTLLCKSRAVELLESELFSDVCIIVNDTKFRCHKVFLASASEFFEKLFQNESDEIRLEGPTPEAFKIILDFIYRENKEIVEKTTLPELLSVMDCAHMWLINVLLDLSLKTLCERIYELPTESLIEIFERAYLRDQKSLMDKIVSHIKGLPKAPSETCKLSLKCFRSYLELSTGTPEELFGMIDNWFEKNPNENNPINVGYLLRLIPFHEMTSAEFQRGPGISKLLSYKDKYEILSQKITEKRCYKLKFQTFNDISLPTHENFLNWWKKADVSVFLCINLGNNNQDISLAKSSQCTITYADIERAVGNFYIPEAFASSIHYFKTKKFNILSVIKDQDANYMKDLLRFVEEMKAMRN